MGLFRKNSTGVEAYKSIGSSDTPDIFFDTSSGVFQISGVSLPENVKEVYAPVFDWLRRYTASPCNKTTLNLNLEYVNTASSKIFDQLLAVFNDLSVNGFKVKVNWYYKRGDKDMLEAGEEMLDGFDFSSEIIARD